MVLLSTRASLSIAAAAVSCLPQVQCSPFIPESRSAFVPFPTTRNLADPKLSTSPVLVAETSTSTAPANDIDDSAKEPTYCRLRRSILTNSLAATLITACFGSPASAIAADGKLDAILGQIKEANKQLEDVPDLIKAEKWDSGKQVLRYF